MFLALNLGGGEKKPTYLQSKSSPLTARPPNHNSLKADLRQDKSNLIFIET